MQLYVDVASEPAIRTYRSLGFMTDHRDVAYMLVVPPGDTFDAGRRPGTPGSS